MTDANDIGYGKPPKRTRFKPGRSGNPKGRPKGSKNIRTLVREVMDERIAVREGGTSRKVSKREAMVRYQVHKAAQGDARATQLVLDLDLRFGDLGERPRENRQLTADDQAVLEALRRREQSLKDSADRSSKPTSAHSGPRPAKGGGRKTKSAGRRRKDGGNKGKE